MSDLYVYRELYIKKAMCDVTVFVIWQNGAEAVLV